MGGFARVDMDGRVWEVWALMGRFERIGHGREGLRRRIWMEGFLRFGH